MNRWLLLLALLCTSCGPAGEIVKKALPALYNVFAEPDLVYETTANDGYRGDPDMRPPDNPPGMWVQTVEDDFKLEVEVPWFLDDMTLTEFFEDAELTIFDDQNFYYGDWLSEDLWKVLKVSYEPGESVTFTADKEMVADLLGGRVYTVNIKCFEERFRYLLKMKL